ncbi:MAG: hypothetical protein ACYSU0_05740 [Planctomycetota bacterium]
MPDDRARPPRFPCVAALLCAGCLGAAAWTWMLYSYAWRLAPSDIFAVEILPEGGLQQTWSHPGTFVRVRGRLQAVDDPAWSYHSVPDQDWTVSDKTLLLGDPKGFVFAPFETNSEARRHVGRSATLTGRVRMGKYFWSPQSSSSGPTLDTAASRFTGASIAGLVVGAMGVFVFTVALRHWLGERRQFREETRA